MPLRPLPIALATAAALALAAPASAADHPVSVVDFAFQSRNIQVAVDDTVTWAFVNGGHTTTSRGRQLESWDSNPSGDTMAEGGTYSHTFTRPGLYSYICRPHESFMSGTVTVGEDEFDRSYAGFKQVRRGRTITFRFKVVEPTRVVAKLRGGARRSATRRRLEPGPYAITFRRLPKGEYRGTLTFTDDFKNESVKKTFTAIR